MVTVEQLLRQAEQMGASDVYLAAGMKPKVKIQGRFKDMEYPDLSGDEAEKLLIRMMNDIQQEEFRRNRSADFMLEFKGIGRFRVHIYERAGYPACCVRVLYDVVRLPEELKEVCQLRQGLVVIAGRPQSGKSTTLAAMTEAISRDRGVHIVTLENPIERSLEGGAGIISQRGIGVDTPSYRKGLADIVHEAADVVVIGQLENEEAVWTAVEAAKMGFLVLTTVNSTSAKMAAEQIAGAFRQQTSKAAETVWQVMKAVVYQSIFYDAENGTTEVKLKVENY